MKFTVRRKGGAGVDLEPDGDTVSAERSTHSEFSLGMYIT